MSPPEAGAPVYPQEKGSRVSHHNDRNPRVLVVEDDYLIAADISAALGREGYQVVGPVAEPRTALDLIARERPDFAILDINLNGEMAFSIADALAEEGVPFLFASGYGTGLVPSRHSAVPFCEKPLRAEDILYRLVIPKLSATLHAGSKGMLATTNLLLQSLDAEDSETLRQHVQRVSLAQGDVARFGDGRVYFPESGLAVARLSGAERGSALALVGAEGVLAAPSWPVHDAMPWNFVWQTEGEAVAIATDILLDAMARSARLAQILSSYQRAFTVQMAWTAQANACLDLLGKLSRCILMAADRLGPQIPLTHTEMAGMLQVRRAGVTEALHKLEGEGAIRSTRCLVTVRDRDQLRRLAGETYGPAEEELGSVLSGWPRLQH
jgi:CheY-like chemotaxis protein